MPPALSRWKDINNDGDVIWRGEVRQPVDVPDVRANGGGRGRRRSSPETTRRSFGFIRPLLSVLLILLLLLPVLLLAAIAEGKTPPGHTLAPLHGEKGPAAAFAAETAGDICARLAAAYLRDVPDAPVPVPVVAEAAQSEGAEFAALDTADTGAITGW